MRPRRIAPGPGQESVWDYPRPPRVQPAARRVRVVLGGVTIVDTDRAVRVLETSHPPVYYLPVAALRDCRITPAGRMTHCEFKGRAHYYTVTAGSPPASATVWGYPQPAPGYESLDGYLAVYPSQVDACYVGDERVDAQDGDFYGGWITSDVVGPFKGGAGTWGW